MNRIELDSYALSAVSEEEMEETEGGFIPLLIGACLLLSGCFNNSNNQSNGRSRQYNLTLNGQSVIGDSSRHDNNGTLNVSATK